MGKSLTKTRPVSKRDGDTSTADRAACRALGSELEAIFGTGFSLVCGETGELVEAAADHGSLDWSLRGEICRAVARRGAPEVIEDEDPVLALAVPLTADAERSIVAVGFFLSRPIDSAERLAAAAHVLGKTGDAMAAWAARQTPWGAGALLVSARLMVDKLAAEAQCDRLADEVAGLSLNLATTYEEISLLYRLTQNLKLSSKDEDLARLALEWLAEVLPVESLAIQLVPAAGDPLSHETRSKPLLLTHGPCPLDAGEFAALVEQFEPDNARTAYILNDAATADPHWAFAAVRQLILVPLSEGSNLFGWLAAFNHTGEQELGTVEASLLTSVAAIMGIHSGNSELYRQQNEFFAGVVRALTSAIDAKDPYTCGHSNRVAQVSVRLAQEMGLDAKQVDTIYLSGMLHDIGKIGINDAVLRKPGRLTPEEYEHIKTHAEIGYRILAGLKELDEVLPVVLHHHEQWDGKGYPFGLAGENIPLLARICAVADGFDAMGSDRPYRKGMPEEQLDRILSQGAGKQWDAEVVAAFFRAREDIREISRRERDALVLDVEEPSDLPRAGELRAETRLNGLNT